jgi:biopolymer transport protein ExbD
MASQQHTFSDINITPLTDIFLVLLIIMMVVGPMLDTHGLKLATPTLSTSDTVTESPKVAHLQLAANGRVSHEGQNLAVGALPTWLRSQQVRYPDGVVIETHPDATHGQLVSVMDAVQGAGITKLAVVEHASR